MRKHNYSINILLVIATLLGAWGNSNPCIAQATPKNDLLLSVSYFNNNNQTQYLVAHAKCKIDGKFQLVPNVGIDFYITNDSAKANLLGTATTNDKGEATLLIPPAAKEEWNKAAQQNFVAVSKANNLYDQTKSSATVTTAKLKIDTAADRQVTVLLQELKGNTWQAVKGVDVKVCVKRFGGDLNISETQTYPTDSLGSVSAAYKRDSLPGDLQGNLILTAKVEDNDNYGNLSIEKQVPWGNNYSYESNYERRTLFARRGHSPIWLELMAYTIVLAVWIILIYLIGLLRRIIKLSV